MKHRYDPRFPWARCLPTRGLESVESAMSKAIAVRYWVRTTKHAWHALLRGHDVRAVTLVDGHVDTMLDIVRRNVMSWKKHKLSALQPTSKQPRTHQTSQTRR